MMTPRERVLAVLRQKTPDRLPREIKLTPPLEEAFETRTGKPAAQMPEHFHLDVREVYFRPPAQNNDFSAYYPEGLPPMPNPAGWEVGEWASVRSPAPCSTSSTSSIPCASWRRWKN